MSVVTISVEDSVERQFRNEVKEHLGKGKGVLGQAVTEAMKLWIQQKTQDDLAIKLKERMEKGYDMGKLLYTKRDELYARK